MIQIYDKNNTSFECNGDAVLFPETCTLEAELNGSWELELSHPIDDEGKWKHIVEGAVIAAPSFVSEKQLYRIYSKEKNDVNVTAYARPIFFDSAHDVFLVDTRPTAKTGQEALDILMEGTKYSGRSDIKKGNTAYYVKKNLIEAINGEEDNSFLNRWGGEILYNNFEVIINERAGGDHGVQILYGKNLASVQETVNCDEIITRIVPVAFNGHCLEGAEPWVDSPNINSYPIVYTKKVEFDDVKMAEDCAEGETGFNTLDELRAELVRRCEQMFNEGCAAPSVNLVVEMVDLAQTDEYKDYKILETVSLGDTVYCKNSKLDIVSDARVIRLRWDCIRNVPERIEIGDFEYQYFNELTSGLSSINSVMNGDKTIMAEKVAGILNAINVQLKYQNNVAQKQEIRAILFEDTDEDSELYGAISIGTQGIQIANKRTEDGRDWDWTTAFTAKGGYADALITGILTDKTGKNWWNLDTGMFHSENCVITGEAKFEGEVIAKTGDIGGWSITKNSINSIGNLIKLLASGAMVLDDSGYIQIGNTKLTNSSHALKVDGGLWIYNGTENLSDGTDHMKIFNLEHVTSGGSLVLGKDGSTVSYLSSSSERYKYVKNTLSDEDIVKAFDIDVVWAKYKEGYLTKEDPMNDQYMPMFIAEDIEKKIPTAAVYRDGKIEDWNERVMIPVMLKMIQSLQKEIKELKRGDIYE
ncbi:MAG: phage tail protein [Lachnospiraceae bacterium]|nr:phage tail protein [Lachnospiraceae bacterium]